MFFSNVASGVQLMTCNSHSYPTNCYGHHAVRTREMHVFSMSVQLWYKLITGFFKVWEAVHILQPCSIKHHVFFDMVTACTGRIMGSTNSCAARFLVYTTVISEKDECVCVYV